MRSARALLLFCYIISQTQLASTNELPVENAIQSDISFEECKHMRLQSPLTWKTKAELEKNPHEPPKKNLESCYGLFHNRDYILDACLKYPIDFNQKCLNLYGNGMGDLPITLAVQKLNEYAVSQLIAHGADARKGHLTHSFPSSCWGESKALPKCKHIFELLLRNGADINDPRSADGLNPRGSIFFGVSSGGSEESLTMLLESGADINATGEYGCTALDLAYAKKDEKRVIFLEKHGARKGMSCGIRRAAAAIPWILCNVVGCNTH